MDEKTNILQSVGAITLGNRLKQIGDEINREIAQVYRSQNIEFEPGWYVIAHYLHENEIASILEIASALNLTHPAAIHFLKRMAKKNLVETYKDKADSRRRMVKLSAAGEKLFEKVRPIAGQIENSLNELISSTGYDVLYIVNVLEKNLKAKSVYKRSLNEIKKKILNEIEIVKYSPKYKDEFKSLNIEWLEKYFTVEEEDEKILSDPEIIIAGGGEIFFAVEDDRAVGTCAVIKKSKKEFELTKMAVTEKARGKQIGKKLALTAIGFSYSEGAKNLTLETSIKLNAAISLYEKLGFEYVNKNTDSKYKRKTFKMKLDLRK